MDVKGGIEEKRVKSTVIRRRAKAEPAVPAESPPSEKEEKGGKGEAGAVAVAAEAKAASQEMPAAETTGKEPSAAGEILPKVEEIVEKE